nr:MAG TPA: hypothetical protein [Caudoviricetes sp.]
MSFLIYLLPVALFLFHLLHFYNRYWLCGCSCQCRSHYRSV